MQGRKKPVIRANAVHHIYQNTRRGHLIFYSVNDYLVLLSIVSLTAQKYGVQILGICMMPDHIHILVKIQEPRQLVCFVRDYTSLFTSKYNEYYHRKGSLMNPYGCAPKIGHKKIRTAIAYLYNNPVENHLAYQAEDDRWNLLAYAVDRYAFSDMLRMDYARWILRKALYVVKDSNHCGRPLEYVEIERITSDLSLRELRQFADYVIWKYNPVDYKSLIEYYGSYEKMLIAINSNTGSEYDIKEDTFAKDHRIYRKMLRDMVTVQRWPSMKEALIAPESERKKMGIQLMRRLGATQKEVSKFLWL